VDRLFNNRTWSAFAVGAMMIAIAADADGQPTGRANEPWDNPWAEPWPELARAPGRPGS